jgi:hypothetical protein
MHRNLSCPSSAFWSGTARAKPICPTNTKCLRENPSGKGLPEGVFLVGHLSGNRAIYLLVEQTKLRTLPASFLRSTFAMACRFLHALPAGG